MTALTLVVMQPVSNAEDPKWSSEDVTFFETRIRPVLIEHCYRCHSSEAAKQKQLRGGLFTDTRSGLLQGGESGPAVVPGEPDASLLLESLRYESFEMPPDGKLPEQVIADFSTWIERGAADPRDGAAAAPSRSIDIKAGRQHWAYQSLTIPPAAPFGVADGPAAIDAWIDRNLSAAGLTPQPEADRTTRARRLSFDLTGLPPTPEQMQQFLSDDRTDAWERYVDRLLASPQFGVRWGRHWLDIARFAESVTLRGLVQHESWRYRDYVIDAFNNDLPFNRFLREQIAGDLLPADSLDERQRQSIATTFLTLTDANLEEQDKEQLRMDVVDEQLIVIGEGLLGQTLGCARCHDHKFDPIPTADYYALAGILRNTRTLQHSNVSRWLERPLPLPPDQERLVAAAEARTVEIQQQVDRLKKRLSPTTAIQRRVVSRDLPGIVIDDAEAIVAGEWMDSTSVKPYVDAGYRHDLNSGCGEKSATFETLLPHDGEYEVRLAYTNGANRSREVPVTIETADGDEYATVNQQQLAPIDGLFISLGRHRFAADTPARVIVSNRQANGHVIIDAVQFLPEKATPRGGNSPPTAATTSADEARNNHLKQRLQALTKDLRELKKSAPARPLYQAVEEETEIEDMLQHIRGNLHNPGPRVPRGFLQVVECEATPEMPTQQSGRRQLGDWLADPTNPLPARVYVNRVWQWLFGVGLVRTPDNLGTRGESPSHPELLNYLAGRFIAEGWSTKQLIRELVRTKTYRRTSAPAESSANVDPENRLLWRMNVKPIEAECLQDAVLSAAGQLDLSLGGPTIPAELSADYGFEHDSQRRAIYWPQLRNSRPPLQQIFDGANPSLVTGRRSTSSVAPQGLFLLNNPWLMHQAEQTVQRLLAERDLTRARRIELLFQLLLGRSPSADERRDIARFLASPDAVDVPDAEVRWVQVVQSLYCSLDFRFLH
ncbi:MAG: DUF1553 domain-containing protein [Planctomycetaceae bacterium]